MKNSTCDLFRNVNVQLGQLYVFPKLICLRFPQEHQYNEWIIQKQNTS